jgi:malate synthase
MRAPVSARYAEVLTNEALAFLADLYRRFEGRRRELLASPSHEDDSEPPGAHQAAAVPVEVADRRAGIVPPDDRRALVVALNSSADVVIADFAAAAASWADCLEGQRNLKARWDGTLSATDPENGREEHVAAHPALLIVRPRGWDLLEEHLCIDDRPIAAALFDFGLYVFHNARAAHAEGGLYVSVAESAAHLGALWREVFAYTEQALALPAGAIRTSVGQG